MDFFGNGDPLAIGWEIGHWETVIYYLFIIAFGMTIKMDLAFCFKLFALSLILLPGLNEHTLHPHESIALLCVMIALKVKRLRYRRSPSR